MVGTCAWRPSARPIGQPRHAQVQSDGVQHATGVTLQVNLAPTDLPHARFVLPHQLRCWACQVDEIVLTLDLHRSHGRYAHGWEARLPGMRRLLAEVCERHPHARAEEVDYSEKAAARLSARFFGGEPIPVKDCHGAPYYSYFHGLGAASNRFVLHMDSDMLFGGGSSTWVAEMLDLMQRRPEVLACNPLPGPPTADGGLRSQQLERELGDGLAYRAPHLSTRLFLIDLERLRTAAGPLPRLRLNGYRAWKARREGHPPYDCAEVTLSAAMARHSLVRVDAVGKSPGCWSLHPPFRSARFYDSLQDVIRLVESGDMPDGQRGHHDVQDCVVDWSDVREGRRAWVGRHWRLVLGR